MENTRVFVGLGSCGIAAGAQDIYDYMAPDLKSGGLDLEVTSCVGMCYAEPIVEIEHNGERRRYGYVDKKFADELLESVKTGTFPEKNMIALSEDGKKYLDRQVKIVLQNCGIINPECIDEYLEADGYKALTKCIEEYKPEEVVSIVKASGLKGRGGAGFLTGLKWSFLAGAKGDKTGDTECRDPVLSRKGDKTGDTECRDPVLSRKGDYKYLVCNADEGDPGAFMDRSILEGDPHKVIEGMLIGAYATGAKEGIIYCRAEYPLAIKRLNIAIAAGEEKNYIGDNILGTDFSFHLHVKEGAGAFVCGEETALMASIEGKRGMPRLRPPFPANSGINKSPTNINNVETYGNVPFIILNGADAFNKYAFKNSYGTKVFALAGKIKRGGLIEVPMGLSIREIVTDIGGGTSSGRPVKAVQMGGPAGGCIPERLFDTPIDYDSINETGAIMGSGGMVVMDDSTCMVDVARYFLSFTQNESCGKCTFCRIGTKRMLEILIRITEGNGKLEDLDKLEELAGHITKTSLCGLGQLAPNPVLTTIKYFREEYEAHIKNRECPAGVCKSLITIQVIPDNCTGCTLCARVCPVSAIEGMRKKIHVIDPETCTRCGLCIEACNFDAIEVV